MEKVYILILTWNAWEDTIECIESVLKLNYDNFQIVIIDNASEDKSLYFFKKYFNREIFPKIKNPKLKDKVLPFIKEKIPFVVYEEEEAFDGGNFNYEKKFVSKVIKYPIIIIKNKGNYGFHKGNNSGLRFVLKRNDFKYVWLLNNDTVVDNNSLYYLVNTAKINNKIGFVGSVLRYYYSPEIIQTIGGGKFFPFLGFAKLYKKNQHISIIKGLTKSKVKKNLNYIMGASLLIKKEVLEEIGILNEDYFLYADEIDIMYRAKKKEWTFDVSLNSYVYHKESLSMKGKKWIYYYRINKSNMIFLKTHYGIFYNLLAFLPMTLNVLRTSKNFKCFLYGIKGAIEGINKKISFNIINE